MEILTEEIKSAVIESSAETLERQVREFVASLDSVVQRLMRRQPIPVPDVECSHQEMKALAVLGRKGTAIMSDLAGVLDVPLSTATHTVDRLVAKGLVERTRLDEDRRIVQVELSDKGKRIHESFLEFRLAMGRTMLEALSPGEREIFLELMAKTTGTP
jgi:DNA-binding MarR family transcriptional regulator